MKFFSSFSSFVVAAMALWVTMVAVVSASNDEPIDIVFAVDEAKEGMQEFHDLLKKSVSDIFSTLEEKTTDFRVGLVGFGADANNGDPRVLSRLTQNSAEFATAVDKLETSGSRKESLGLQAVKQIAINAVGSATLTKRGVRAATSKKSLVRGKDPAFPRDPGFCVILISNDDFEPVWNKTHDILFKYGGILYGASKGPHNRLLLDGINDDAPGPSYPNDDDRLDDHPRPRPRPPPPDYTYFYNDDNDDQPWKPWLDFTFLNLREILENFAETHPPPSTQPPKLPH